MKFKTTKKLMRDNYYHIMGVGYCSLQQLLGYESPIAYSTRTEGWACDYYEIDGVLISTGYAPLKSKNTKISYDRLNSYEKEASTIRNSDLTYEDKAIRLGYLLRTMIKEAKEQD